MTWVNNKLFRQFNILLLSFLLVLSACNVQPNITNNIDSDKNNKSFNIKNYGFYSYNNKLLLDQKDVTFLGINFKRIQISESDINFKDENNNINTVSNIIVSYSRVVDKSARKKRYTDKLERASFSLYQPEQDNINSIKLSNKDVIPFGQIFTFYKPEWFSNPPKTNEIPLEQQELYFDLEQQKYLEDLDSKNREIQSHYPDAHYKLDNVEIDSNGNEIDTDNEYHTQKGLIGGDAMHYTEPEYVGNVEIFELPAKTNGRFTIVMNTAHKKENQDPNQTIDEYVIDTNNETDLLKNAIYYEKSYPQDVELKIENIDNNITQLKLESSVSEQFSASLTSSNGYNETFNASTNNNLNQPAGYLKEIDKRLLKSGLYTYDVFFPFSNIHKSITFSVDCSTPDILDSIDNKSFSTKFVAPDYTYKPRCPNTKRAINPCEDIPNCKAKSDNLNNIQKDITLNIKNLNKLLPKPKFTTKFVESDNLKNSIIEKITTLNTTKSELQTLVNSIQLSSDPTETEPIDEPDINEPEPNNGNPPINIELRKQELETLTTEFNNSLGKVSKANSENIIKAVRTLVKEIDFYQNIANEYLSIAETKPKDIIPLISKTSNRINNHLARINKVNIVKINGIQEDIDSLSNIAKALEYINSQFEETEEDSFNTLSFSTKAVNTNLPVDVSQGEYNQALSLKQALWEFELRESQAKDEEKAQYQEARQIAEKLILDVSITAGTAIAPPLIIPRLGALAVASKDAYIIAMNSPKVINFLTRIKEYNVFRNSKNFQQLCAEGINPEQANQIKNLTSNLIDKTKDILKAIGKGSATFNINILLGRNFHFVGGIRTVALRGITHQDAVKAFLNTGLIPSGHFIKRMKDARTFNLGLKTFEDLEAIFRKGVITEIKDGVGRLQYGKFEVILNVTNGKLITLKPIGV